jgi:hypothetical protein
MSTGVHHPVFARIYARFGEAAEAKGATEHRDELLAGITGRVIEIGAGNGLNFSHYPTTVTTPGVRGRLDIIGRRPRGELSSPKTAITAGPEVTKASSSGPRRSERTLLWQEKPRACSLSNWERSMSNGSAGESLGPVRTAVTAQR